MKILLFCSLILISTKSMAQASSWMGYKPAANLNFPFQNFIENSIYRMTTVGAVDHPSVQPEVVDLTQSPYNRATTDSHKIENDPRSLAIETCRNQGLIKCPVISAASTMTAFFNNGGLHTCRHGFHNWLLWAAQLNDKTIDSISPPVILYDRSGKMIYNSAQVKKENLLYFTFIDKNPALEFTMAKGFTMNGKINFTNSDYTEMKTPLKIFKDYNLQTAKSRDQIMSSTDLYMFGYPAKTDYLGTVVGNAPGKQLVGSQGNLRSFPSDSTLFQSTHLAMGGASGSPVLDPEGTLLGVSCYGSEVVYGINEVIGDSQVIFHDKTFLKKFWSRQ